MRRIDAPRAFVAVVAGVQTMPVPSNDDAYDIPVRIVRESDWRILMQVVKAAERHATCAQCRDLDMHGVHKAVNALNAKPKERKT